MIKFKKRWAASMAAVSMAAFMSCTSALPVFAQSNENAAQNTENPVSVEEVSVDENKDEQRDVSGSLTPDGSLTLVDDLDSESSKELQFMTVTTRDGSYYYIIIDRTGDSENVHFLNAVDTVDLMNLMSDEEKTQLEENNKPEIEQVLTPEVSIEGEENTETESQETVAERDNMMHTALPALGIFAALAALISGAYYMLKNRPKKAQNDIDEDREFYDDDEYENEDEILDELDSEEEEGAESEDSEE